MLLAHHNGGSWLWRVWQAAEAEAANKEARAVAEAAATVARLEAEEEQEALEALAQLQREISEEAAQASALAAKQLDERQKAVTMLSDQVSVCFISPAVQLNMYTQLSPPEHCLTASGAGGSLWGCRCIRWRRNCRRCPPRRR